MEFSRRACFRDEEDDGLASIAGFSGNNNHNINNGFLCNYSMNRRNSLRNLDSLKIGNIARFHFEDSQQQPHFLESCFLCNKPLGGNRDIFMYRGDTPFCSEECRQEQIDMDEAKEKNWNLSSSMKALRRKDQRKDPSSSTKNQDYAYRTDTVAAAA